MLIFGRFDGSVLQSTTNEGYMFLFLFLPPDNNFFYSLSTSMSVYRSILCPIVVLPLFLVY